MTRSTLLAVFLVWLGIGAAQAQGLFGEVSDEQEVAVGADLSASLLGAAPLLADDALQAYVNRVGLWLALQSERPHLPWRFGVLDTDTVNAFAAPGGYVFITRGLFQVMANENELAGALAHEIAHVLRRHHLAAIQKQLVGGLVAGVAAHLLIEDDTVANAVAGAGMKLYARGLDRQDELDADRIGVVLAARAGYVPYGLPNLLLRLDGMSADDATLALMFSTHPATRDRLTALDESMGAVALPGNGPAGADTEFQRYRASLGTTGARPVAAGVDAPAPAADTAAPAAALAEAGLGTSTLGALQGDVGRLLRPPQPGETFRDPLRDGAMGPEMVALSDGAFRMGDRAGEPQEQPVHKVTLARPFALSRFEITFEEYDRFARVSGRPLPADDGVGRGRLPVINVSWADANAYAAWLAAQTGRGYRLPSEAEWEYAARAGTRGARPWDGDAQACRYANVGDRSLKQQMTSRGVSVSGEHRCDDGFVGPAPVGSFEANTFGLQDMLGNVFEWTADCGQASYLGAPTDGSAWTTPACSSRVSRGGSWESNPAQVRSALRALLQQDYKDSRLGFRVARDL